MVHAHAWHYTTGICWRQIECSGVIRASQFLLQQGERPAVWFTDSDVFEPTAIKMGVKRGRSLDELLGIPDEILIQRKVLSDMDGPVYLPTPQEFERVMKGLFRVAVNRDAKGLMSFREWTEASGVSSRLA